MAERAAHPAVFVYGTLLPGESRWPVLAPFAVDDPVEASVDGWLYDTGRGFPAAVFVDHGTRPRGPGTPQIPGVRVSVVRRRRAEAIALLDQIEGEGTLYRRVEVETSAGPATSYAWMGDSAGLHLLEGGWRSRPSDG